MEFVVPGWCAGKQLGLDRTIKELGMFDNYYIDQNTFKHYCLTKLSSATEVVTILL